MATLNGCLSGPVRQNILRARIEPVMLANAMRSVRGGAYAALMSGLIGGLSELGDASYTWNGDVENPGRAPGRQERSDVHELRLIADSIIGIAGSRAWQTACRPCPYDPAEHSAAVPLHRSAHRPPIRFSF